MELEGAVGKLEDREVGAGLFDDVQDIGDGRCIIAEPCIEGFDLEGSAGEDELVLVEQVGTHA